MSQNIRDVCSVSPRHGRIWKVDGSGCGEHVGFENAGQAFDGGAVEAEAFLEGTLNFGRRQRHRLQ